MQMITADWLVARAYLLRGMVLWLLARILISMAMLLANIDPFALAPRSSVIIILIATGLGFAQAHRLREGVMLGNLGVSRPMLALGFALPAFAGELIIALAGAAFA